MPFVQLSKIKTAATIIIRGKQEVPYSKDDKYHYENTFPF